MRTLRYYDQDGRNLGSPIASIKFSAPFPGGPDLMRRYFQQPSTRCDDAKPIANTSMRAPKFASAFDVPFFWIVFLPFVNLSHRCPVTDIGLRTPWWVAPDSTACAAALRDIATTAHGSTTTPQLTQPSDKHWSVADVIRIGVFTSASKQQSHALHDNSSIFRGRCENLVLRCSVASQVGLKVVSAADAGSEYKKRSNGCASGHHLLLSSNNSQS